MRNLFSALEQFDSSLDYVLAIITATEGSTYRKAGAMMLINPQLKYWGLLSGGCLEGDIQQHSAEVFTNSQDKTIHYDMRGDEDLIWGMGLGCDGAIEILLKCLPANKNHLGFFEILQQVVDETNHLLIIDADKRLHYQSILKNQKTYQLPNSKNSTKVKLQSHSINNHLIVPLITPVNILICGASPDVPPVSSIAKQLGWKTCVIDHRAEFANPAHFNDANQVKHVKRSQWQNFDVTKFDAVVIMSHQFDRDQDYLKRLLNTDIPYIGLLGPKARRDKLLAQCATEFSKQEGRIYGPVGLDIGADSPETIALAIIAEIQAVKAKKQVGFCYQDDTR